MSIGGSSDRSNINRLRQAGGASSAGSVGAAGPSSKIFSLGTPPAVGNVSGPMSASTRGALVQRIRERLGTGQTADAVLQEEVSREVTSLIGRADPRLVDRVTQDVRSDPAISDMFRQLVRRASDNSTSQGMAPGLA